jgi:hypothetical protein
MVVRLAKLVKISIMTDATFWPNPNPPGRSWFAGEFWMKFWRGVVKPKYAKRSNPARITANQTANDMRSRTWGRLCTSCGGTSASVCPLQTESAAFSGLSPDSKNGNSKVVLLVHVLVLKTMMADMILIFENLGNLE